MYVEKSRSTIQGDGPSAIAYPEIPDYKPTDKATRLVGCIMATLMLSGTQPYEAKAFELGPHYRSQRLTYVTTDKTEPNWQADPISTRLDTPVGNIQRYALALAFPRDQLREDVQSLDSITLKVTTAYALDEDSHSKERTVAQRTVTVKNLKDYKTPDVAPQNKTYFQSRIDLLGNSLDTKSDIFLPLSALGANTLYVTKKRGRSQHTESLQISSTATEACSKSTVITIDDPSVFAYKRLCKAVGQLRPFMNADPLIALGSAGDNEQVSPKHANNTSPSLIDLKLPFLRDAQGVDIGASIPRHELAHAVFSGLSEADQAALSNKYKNIIGHMNYALPSQDDIIGKETGRYYDVADNEPLWAIITESTYERELGNALSTNGHPYDSSNELFASAVNVYSTYGEQFVAQFNKLSPHQQDIHRQLFTTITDILQRQSTSNDPMDDITNLIPNYWHISQALFCSKPQSSSASNS